MEIPVHVCIVYVPMKEVEVINAHHVLALLEDATSHTNHTKQFLSSKTEISGTRAS